MSEATGGDAGAPAGGQSTKRNLGSGQHWIAAGLIAGAIVIAFVMFLDTREPDLKNPGFLETIVNDRVTLTVVRVGLLAAVLYVLISVVALVWSGRWLSRAGPFGVDDVRRVLDNQDDLRRQLDDALAENDRLSEELDRLADVLEPDNGPGSGGGA